MKSLLLYPWPCKLPESLTILDVYRLTCDFCQCYLCFFSVQQIERTEVICKLQTTISYRMAHAFQVQAVCRQQQCADPPLLRGLVPDEIITRKGGLSEAPLSPVSSQTRVNRVRKVRSRSHLLFKQTNATFFTWPGRSRTTNSLCWNGWASFTVIEF